MEGPHEKRLRESNVKKLGPAKKSLKRRHKSQRDLDPSAQHEVLLLLLPSQGLFWGTSSLAAAIAAVAD